MRGPRARRRATRSGPTGSATRQAHRARAGAAAWDDHPFVAWAYLLDCERRPFVPRFQAEAHPARVRAGPWPSFRTVLAEQLPDGVVGEDAARVELQLRLA